jgi:ubiquinone/menaquinone biosynthesis C-methylase UbiE
MGRPVAYDGIADWYETAFLGAQADRDPLGIERAVRTLLGTGGGTCLEVGCGTGIHARKLRQLGWNPLGVDLSAGMLRYARGPAAGSASRRRAAAGPGRVGPSRPHRDGAHRHAGVPGGGR